MREREEERESEREGEEKERDGREKDRGRVRQRWRERVSSFKSFLFQTRGCVGDGPNSQNIDSTSNSLVESVTFR